MPIILLINHLYEFPLGIQKGQQILQTPLDMLERQRLLPRMECDLVLHKLQLSPQMVRL